MVTTTRAIRVTDGSAPSVGQPSVRLRAVAIALNVALHLLDQRMARLAATVPVPHRRDETTSSRS